MSSKRKFGFWRALYLALYSRELYRDVAKNWTGSAAFHLLLLTLLSCTFNVAANTSGWNQPSHPLTTEVAQTSSSATVSADGDRQIHISSETTKTKRGNSALVNIIITSLTVIFSLLAYALTLLVSLVATALAKIVVETLTFKAIYRLAIVSMTPSFIIGSAIFALIPIGTLSTLSIAFPAALILLPLGYFIYGIRANVAHHCPPKIKLNNQR